MRIAHLILAHNHPTMLERLIERLDHPQSDFFIHLDAKSDWALFSYLEKKKNVFFVKNRINVKWGGFSIVKATLNGIDEISDRSRDFGYVNLLSGQDYPLASANKIYDFFSANKGKIFTEYKLVNEQWTEAKKRIERYYFTDTPFPGSYYLENLISTMLPKRTMPYGMIPVGRSQWFSCSGLHAYYILEFLIDFPKFEPFFKTTWGSDELFFQTLFYNSDYQSDMVNDNLRYIDWSEGNPSPKTLTMADADKLVSCGKLFARKFNPQTDLKILDFIDKNLLV